jgi:uncharacterized protein (UPF0548 family)
MFSYSKPTRNTIDRFITSARETDFTYPYIGRTKDGFRRRPKQKDTMAYKIDHNSIIIGRGESDFEKASQAIRDWKMFEMPWVELCWPDTPIEEDRTVAVLIRHFGFYSLNAARIVYTIDKWDWFGFAYGTLRDHGESGEERFSVRLDRETGEVIYDLYAFSRPNHLSARLAYPLTRTLQKRFAQDSKAAMLHAVKTFG